MVPCASACWNENGSIDHLVHASCEVEWETRGNLTCSVRPEIRREQNTGDSDGQLTSVSEVIYYGDGSTGIGHPNIAEVISQGVRLTVDPQSREAG